MSAGGATAAAPRSRGLTSDAGCGFFGLLTRHPALIGEMVRRDIRERFAGQVFGALWAFGHPLLLMGVYVTVFGFVARSRLPETDGSLAGPGSFTLYILAGLVPWLAFAEAVNRCTMCVVANGSLVKQVVFPVSILPLKTVIASLVPQAAATVFLVAFGLVTAGWAPWTIVLFPVALLLQVTLALGVGYAFAAAGVYLRDLKDIVQVAMLVGLYITPTFYPPEAVPGVLRPILYLNPFSYITWAYQDVFYFGGVERWWAWAVAAVLGPLSLTLGFRVFRELRTGFGNVL